MTIPSSLYLASIVNGADVDVTKVNGELAWIENRAFDAGNTSGDTLRGSVNYANDTGAANAYVVTLSPALTALVTGNQVTFKVANANTGASTLNVNGLGVRSVLKNGGDPLVAGDLIVGAVVVVRYDGTAWQIVSHPGVLPIANAIRYEYDMVFGCDFRSAEEVSMAAFYAGLTGTGSISPIADALGVYRLSTGTAYDSIASYSSDGSGGWRATAATTTNERVVAAAITTGAIGLTNKVFVFGFGNTTVPGFLTSSNPTYSGAFFRVELDGPSPFNVWCVTKNVGAETVTDTNIEDSATKRIFEVMATSNAVTFYIDGVLRATHTTNIYTDLDVHVVVGIHNQNVTSTENKAIDIDWIRCQSPVGTRL